MRRRFRGGTSHISDMLENGIWVITLYEGIIKGDRYDNRFMTPGMIRVIEDNIRFCYREFNVRDYTPIKWIEGVGRIPDIPYAGDTKDCLSRISDIPLPVYSAPLFDRRVPIPVKRIIPISYRHYSVTYQHPQLIHIFIMERESG